MLLTYSVMPLDSEHFEERLADIRDQYTRGITSCPMFIMSLVPEGTPVWDKVGPLCRIYRRYREALAAWGIPSGVLVQSSIGHEYAIAYAPFPRYVSIKTGEEIPAYCPTGQAFIAHFQDVLRAIANEKPHAIMLDDDFRMVMRGAQGCACEEHLRALKKKTGRAFTRASLWAHVQSHPSDDPITVAFLQTQEDSLTAAAKAFRAAIDEIDPSIQGINCTSGDLCESVHLTSKLFCGKGNPTIVRVPNGSYAPVSTKGFSALMRSAAICASKLKKHGIDHLLAETDTIPFNRYGKSARYLHAHMAASMLEGLVGAKHWLTRSVAFEPRSGIAFRDILAKHRYLYEKLSKLAEEIRWQGANAAFIEQTRHAYDLPKQWQYLEHTWITKVFERLGLPFYFSEQPSRFTLLEGRIVRDMSDEQIAELFQGTVCMTSEAAADLITRGYGSLLGVAVDAWDGPTVSGEMFESPNGCASKQKLLRRLTVTDGRVEVLSYCYQKVGVGKKPLFPAVTVLERAPERLSVVFCGTPNAEHNYYEGFSFLTETRKRQLIGLMERAGALPLYCEDDVELCLRVGALSDGRLLCAVYHLGLDPLDTLALRARKIPERIKRLDENGEEQPVSFTALSDGRICVQVRVEPMYPVFLLLD